MRYDAVVKNVITYGTFDLLHYGHIELLRRAKETSEGGLLYVGLSSEKFNELKGKKTYLPFDKRKRLLESIKHVDFVFPENDWAQKESDIKKYDINIFLMGHDWTGKFDHLSDLCEVLYLERTPDVSSTAIKQVLDQTDSNPTS